MLPQLWVMEEKPMRTRALGSLILAGLRVLGESSQLLEYTTICAPLCQRFSSGILEIRQKQPIDFHRSMVGHMNETDRKVIV